MTPRLAYFDTSLIIPLYVRGKVSPLAERALAEFTNNAELPIVISGLTRLEFVSTIAKHVRMGQLNKEQAGSIIDVFEQHCRRDFLMLPIQWTFTENRANRRSISCKVSIPCLTTCYFFARST